MPLKKSSSESAFKANVAAERNAGKPRAQSLAIAYSVQRKADGHARGGAPVPNPGGSPEGVVFHDHGLIHGPGTGRSDSIHMSVPKGGYMIPADVVSGIGHGNSISGANALDHSFPHDTKVPIGRAHVRGFAPMMKRPFEGAFQTKKYADGGGTDRTEILGSAGEFFLSPRSIVKKYGTLKNGHRVLDHWVQKRRKTNIKEQQKLKGPKGAKKI